ncbi:MAG: hypothetical protein JNL52_01030 [Flavobacteriales bacterium]|nr:hypothetical protein [Flavobacteriales bacterium]
MARTPGMKGLTTQRLIALFGFFALLLQYPLLRLSDRAERMAGIPVLYLHVLLGWLLLIALVAMVVNDKQRRERSE